MCLYQILFNNGLFNNDLFYIKYILILYKSTLLNGACIPVNLSFLVYLLAQYFRYILLTSEN